MMFKRIRFPTDFPRCLWTMPKTTTPEKSGRSKSKNAPVQQVTRVSRVKIVTLVTRGRTKVYTLALANRVIATVIRIIVIPKPVYAR